jgi:hypothetical protein
MQLEPWLSPDTWFSMILLVVVPIAFILWVIYKTCTGRATTRQYARSRPRSVDGSGGISAAHGADISYFPTDTCTPKGAFPVSGLGPLGKGGYGYRPHDKNE